MRRLNPTRLLPCFQIAWLRLEQVADSRWWHRGAVRSVEAQHLSVGCWCRHLAMGRTWGRTIRGRHAIEALTPTVHSSQPSDFAQAEERDVLHPPRFAL
eukprot:4855363-Amphidinium_carterae.1